jgi:hypothetical protein
MFHMKGQIQVYYFWQKKMGLLPLEKGGGEEEEEETHDSVTCMSVIIDQFWIGNWIYWTFTECNYK